MSTQKLRIAVFGCGRMGLHHVRAIGTVEHAAVVAVCDPAADPATVKAALPADVALYQDATRLLQEVRPDVVHIVTPPETHAPLALLALEHGAHVYVEKPFALTADDAKRVVTAAQEKGLSVCAGHQVLFQASGRRYRDYLPMIGKVVHVESYFSFKTVRRSGGGLYSPVEQLIDILPHPVYLMLSAFEASGQYNAESACTLRSFEVDPNGEIRALIKHGDCLALLTVTLRGRPIESYLRVVGTNGSVTADFVLSGVTKLYGPGASAISAVIKPFSQARQMVAGTVANIFRMVFRKHKSYAGLAELIDAFYASIRHRGPSPVSPLSIVETVRLCETIGRELESAAAIAEAAARERVQRQESALAPPDAARGVVLVTGGTGFLGRVLVAELRAKGWPVRVVARRLPLWSARLAGVEYVLGDISRPLSTDIFKGVAFVAHLAAETYGGKAEHELNTIQATRNVLDAMVRAGVKRIVYTSSIAVHKPSREVGGPLVETSPVDYGNLGRGPYVWAKAESEAIIGTMSQQHGILHRTIRLGPLVDFQNFTPPGRLGREVGPLYVAAGSRSNILSVCDVRTASHVIRHYIEEFERVPPVLNLVEAQAPTRADLVARLRQARPDLKVMWLPAPVLWTLSATLKLVLRVLRPGKKPLDLYSAFASERYNNALAVQVVRAADPQACPN